AMVPSVGVLVPISGAICRAQSMALVQCSLDMRAVTTSKQGPATMTDQSVLQRASAAGRLSLIWFAAAAVHLLVRGWGFTPALFLAAGIILAIRWLLIRAVATSRPQDRQRPDDTSPGL